MGRSGGGHHGGGGGGYHGGGSHHHSSYHRSSYHSSYHRSYSSGSSYHYSSGGSGGCNCLVCIMCLIPVFFVVFVTFIVLVLINDGMIVADTALTKCEQFVVCPDKVTDGKVHFKTDTRGPVAGLYYTLPNISNSTSYTNLRAKDKYLDYGDYAYRSFNLITGSTLQWNIDKDYYTSSSLFSVYLVKGMENVKKIDRNEPFTSIYRSERQIHSSYQWTATSDGEFFVVAKATRGYLTLTNILYNVTHTRYETEKVKAAQTCDDNCVFNLNQNNSKAYVIVELPCSATGKSAEEGIDIEVKYKGDHSTTFYVCLVFTIVGGTALVGSILACVLCCVCNKKGTQGQTYNSVPSTTATVTTLPAGNPAVVNSSYQQTTYTPVPPAYASSNPAPPTYVPYDPSYGISSNPAPTTYGTAPPAYDNGVPPTYNSGSAPSY